MSLGRLIDSMAIFDTPQESLCTHHIAEFFIYTPESNRNNTHHPVGELINTFIDPLLNIIQILS